MKTCQTLTKPWVLGMGCLVLLLALAGCHDYSDRVRISGSFSGLKQSEFLIYSSDGAMPGIDTLHVEDGSFYYELPLQREATLHIIYPNQSQLTLFVHGGDHLKVKGSANSLSEVSVSGNDDNELYTDFRLEALGLSDSMTLDLAEHTIREHPTSAVSRYLLQRYFIDDQHASRERTHELYELLTEANPQNMSLAALSAAISSYRLLDVGQPLPPFELKVRPTAYTHNRTDSIVSNTSLHGQYVLMYFWATWKNSANVAPYYARQHRLKSGMKQQAIISYSLDASEKLLAETERRDTINYISYCDFQSFASPLVQRWGIRDLPYFIYADTTGVILASGSDWKRDIEPTLKDLCW